MNNVIQQVTGILGAVAIVIGALECYFGYKIFKIQVAIIGFLLGFAIGVFGAGILADSPGLGILAGIILGVLFVVLSLKVYFAGVFLFVGSMGFLIGFLTSQNVWFGVILGVTFGVLGAFAAKHIIIISTSLSGGVLMGVGLSGLIGSNILAVIIIGSTIFAATGLYVQYKMDRKNNKNTAVPPQPVLQGSNTASSFISDKVQPFLNRSKKNMSYVAYATAKKSGELVETTKLNVNISGEEREIANLYTALGEKCYRLYTENTSLPDETAGICEQISQRLSVVSELKQKLSDLKNQNQVNNQPPTQHQVQNQIQIRSQNQDTDIACPSCGTALPADAKFCDNCGNNMQGAEV